VSILRAHPIGSGESGPSAATGGAPTRTRLPGFFRRKPELDGETIVDSPKRSRISRIGARSFRAGPGCVRSGSMGAARTWAAATRALHGGACRRMSGGASGRE